MSLAPASPLESAIAQVRQLLELEGCPSDPDRIHARLVGVLLEKDCPVPGHDCAHLPALRSAVAELSWPQTLEQMLCLGVSVDDRNCRGDTALHLAFAVDEAGAALQLLMDSFLPAARENLKNIHGLSFLHIACARSASAAAVQSLLGRFLFDIDCQVSSSVESPYAGYTPLHFAVHHGQHEVATLLLRHDADFCAQDRSGSSPLHLAFERGDINMIDLILHNDHLHDNCANNFGLTHFMVACAGSLGSVVHEFLRAAETVRRVPASSLVNDRVRDSRHPLAGYTPLHFAAQRGNAETVRLLLEHGASCFAMASLGNVTPLDVARARGFEEICQLLQKFGEGRKEALLISWMEGMMVH